jgi:hypothetical protein
MTEGTVGWFGVRKKYYSLAEKVRLISQTSPNEPRTWIKALNHAPQKEKKQKGITQSTTTSPVWNSYSQSPFPMPHRRDLSTHWTEMLSWSRPRSSPPLGNSGPPGSRGFKVMHKAASDAGEERDAGDRVPRRWGVPPPPPSSQGDTAVVVLKS